MKLVDLTGQTFGRLEVACRGQNDKYGNAQWWCVCDCGTITTKRGSHLNFGDTESCGCLASELSSDRLAKSGSPARTHGMSKTKEHSTWRGMIKRCTNQNSKDYVNYGGRGITVCDEWTDSFEAFYAHVGPVPSLDHSIDRIDNDGNYEPGNVRWASADVQVNNRRCSRNKKPDPLDALCDTE